MQQCFPTLTEGLHSYRHTLHSFTLHAGSPTPCSRCCMQLLFLVSDTFTHIFSLLAPGQKCISRQRDERQTCFWNNSDCGCFLMRCVCVYVCGCSKATGRPLLAPWAMETASTRADPKTKVSEHKKQSQESRNYRYVRAVLVLTSASALRLCYSDGWGQQWVVN